MRVPINIASRPADSTRPLRMCAFALGLLAMVLGGIAVRSELRARNEFRSLVDQTSQLESEIRDLEATQQEMQNWLETPQVTQIRKRSALLNSLINQKSLSWTRMFQDLETTLPAGARITSIKPKTNDSAGGEGKPELSLTVAAATVGPIVDFIKRMEDSRQFANPVVSDQRFPSARDTEGEVEVSLSTHYAQEAIQGTTADDEAASEAEEIDSEPQADNSAGRAGAGENVPLAASKANPAPEGARR